MAQLLLKKRPRRRADEPVMAWPLRRDLPQTDVQALLDKISDVLAGKRKTSGLAAVTGVQAPATTVRG